MGEAAIISKLIDPGSAQLTWHSGIHRGVYKPFLAKKVYGYMACGFINARNRMGGFAGRQPFVVVIDQGAVQYSEIERGSLSDLEKNCLKAVRLGLFPPAPLGGAPLTQAAMPVQALTTPAPAAAPVAGPTGFTKTGLSIRSMPEGAYVADIVPGSPAAVAGLMPGMVITRVDGIPLGGMGDAIAKVITAAEIGSTLELVGGKTVKLGVK